jgi:hypothetical protein
MEKVYECDLEKQNDLKKILEADPYAEGSFARTGYKLKDGATVDANREKVYLYISASEEFLKKADDLLKDFAKASDEQTTSKVISKIKEEENTVASGVAMFGE